MTDSRKKKGKIKRGLFTEKEKYFFSKNIFGQKISREGTISHFCSDLLNQLQFIQ